MQKLLTGPDPPRMTSRGRPHGPPAVARHTAFLEGGGSASIGASAVMLTFGAGKKMGGRPPHVPDPAEAKPDPKAQRNFTDPESRIMKDGASKSFEQCYNAQAAVDGEAQIIVAADVTQQPNDKQQLVPMMLQVIENMGRAPKNGSADSGYFSEAAVTHPDLAGIDLHVPPRPAEARTAASRSRG